ncbi:SpoIIE family protein phosphatase [Roseinatronobacter monicus]
MEREVRTARGQLLAAVEALDDGFVYFDADDRLVLANRKYGELYQIDPAILVKGARFEDLLRHNLAQGRYPDAIGREEDWLRHRLERFRNTGRSSQRLSDGRVLQIVERRTDDGGRVGLRVDVTELSLARENARNSEARALQQNRDLRAALDELQNLYDAIDRDLMEARKLQHSLIRKRQHDFDGSTLSLLLKSSGHVGGDMVGTFIISTARIGIYAIDVSGHGVAAAMLGARIAGLFSGGEHQQNIVLIRDPKTGKSKAYDPHDVAARINELMLDEFETETYLTIAYADIDLQTGKMRLVQAGHPHPVIQRADGRVEFIGDGGLPIGLIPNARFATIEAQLMPGDRLLLYSDGVTECINRNSEEFGEDGLRATLVKLAKVKGTDFVDALKWELMHWSGKDEFDDDVSGALLEFNHATYLTEPPSRYYRGVRIEE